MMSQGLDPKFPAPKKWVKQFRCDMESLKGTDALTVLMMDGTRVEGVVPTLGLHAAVGVWIKAREAPHIWADFKILFYSLSPGLGQCKSVLDRMLWYLKETLSASDLPLTELAVLEDENVLARSIAQYVLLHPRACRFVCALACQRVFRDDTATFFVHPANVPTALAVKVCQRLMTRV